MRGGWCDVSGRSCSVFSRAVEQHSKSLRLFTYIYIHKVCFGFQVFRMLAWPLVPAPSIRNGQWDLDWHSHWCLGATFVGSKELHPVSAACKTCMHVCIYTCVYIITHIYLNMCIYTYIPFLAPAPTPSFSFSRPVALR